MSMKQADPGCSSKGSAATIKPDKLSLEVIIGKFSSPLTEEHAWAIVYEALKCLENLLRTYLVSTPGNTCQDGKGKKGTTGQQTTKGTSGGGPNKLVHKDIHLVRDTKEIFINFDGRVHESTFLDPILISTDGKTSFFLFSDRYYVFELRYCQS